MNAEYRGMTDWESITCQNPNPHEHRTIVIDVDLSERHGYLNFAPIPERLWLPPFRMEVWDWAAAAEASMPVEGEWCPMRCAISQTIAEHGIWEPPETLTLLNVFEAARLIGGHWQFVDFGAQIGWFSMLAEMTGLYPVCFEADREVAEILARNLKRAGDLEYLIATERIGKEILPPVPASSPTIAKIDIEGAEPDALDLLRPALDVGTVKALLIESTPRFGVDVEAMATELINHYGFEAFLLPHILDEEYTDYDQIEDLELTVDPKHIADRAVAGNQINVLYMQPDMPTIV